MKMKAMKEKTAQTTSQPAQPILDSADIINQKKIEKYLETKENQNKILDKTREEIENLQNILSQENLDKKDKDLADIEMEMKRCYILIQETTMELIIEIQ